MADKYFGEMSTILVTQEMQVKNVSRFPSLHKECVA